MSRNTKTADGSKITKGISMSPALSSHVELLIAEIVENQRTTWHATKINRPVAILRLGRNGQISVSGQIKTKSTLCIRRSPRVFP